MLLLAALLPPAGEQNRQQPRGARGRVGRFGLKRKLMGMNGKKKMMKHITFRRRFPRQPDREISSATFQVETNDDKMNLVKLIVDERDGLMKDFICGRIDVTTIFNVPYPPGGFQLKRALQLHQMCAADDGNIEIVENSLTFYISTDAEKLAFAEWVIKESFGDFLHDNAYIFISHLHVPVIGQPLMVPIAQQVASPDNNSDDANSVYSEEY